MTSCQPAVLCPRCIWTNADVPCYPRGSESCQCSAQQADGSCLSGRDQFRGAVRQEFKNGASDVTGRYPRARCSTFLRGRSLSRHSFRLWLWLSSRAFSFWVSCSTNRWHFSFWNRQNRGEEAEGWGDRPTASLRALPPWAHYALAVIHNSACG